MEMLKRKIRLFFVSYGKLFAYIIGAICIVVFVLDTVDYIVGQQMIDKHSDPQYQREQEEWKKELEDRKVVSQFIEYCNTGKIEEAYKMLSNQDKNRYPTINIFKQEYIDRIFNVNICDSKIEKNLDGTYKAILVQDMLVTGTKNSTREERYIVIKEGLENKIYIL